MSQEEFKSMLLSALVDDEQFAANVLDHLAEQISVSLNVESAWNEAVALEVRISLGSSSIYDRVSLPRPE